ncbi:MAG: COX15/CtaA family protein [Chloroflexi bacterium]|nr:COX15/CtaA family protein [Chloroflexota bacterium]
MIEPGQPESSYKPFVGLSLATAALTLGLIVFGAIVRVTDSGLGCGNDWPLCNGSVFPPLDNINAWIEWLHRLFAMLIGLFGLVTLVVAWRQFRPSKKRILNMTKLAAILFVIQSGLGAVVVFLDLPPTFVTLHLGVAMLLLGALIAASVMAWYRPQLTYQADSVRTLTFINAVFSLLVILTGALVRGSGASFACTVWPLCDAGNLLPFELGQLAIIHMIHRLAVAAMGLTVLILLRQVFKKRQERLVKQIALAIVLVFLLQVGAGAAFVFSIAAAEWGAIHVGLAATVWGLLVVLATIESLNHQNNTNLGLNTE